jgi:Tol biopolymer transport system component
MVARWQTLAFTMASPPTKYQIFTASPDGSHLAQITSSGDGTLSFGPMWSPDGSRLLFIRGTELRSAMDVWIVKADGTNPVQVTHSPAGYGGYAWVPG